MGKQELRHHRIDADDRSDGTAIEVWDDDNAECLVLVVEPARSDWATADITPAKARALAALLIMAAENRERRQALTPATTE